MDRICFLTDAGVKIPAVTADEMREVDRIAVEVFQLGILQMMENAGRDLALLAMRMLKDVEGPITILAGSGGNGGGGLCCARHLMNHGYNVRILPTHPLGDLQGSVKYQMEILLAADAQVVALSYAEASLDDSVLIIDALIGYSLRGAPGGNTAQLIELANARPTPILSLDLPSGWDATHGRKPGVCIQAETTLTLALPKTGLQDYSGELYLGDIGIPSAVYRSLGFEPPPFPVDEYLPHLHHA